MEGESTPYRVNQCSKCQEDTEYFCESCLCHLCQSCKENHQKNLKTIDHYVATYRNKCSQIAKQEICARHRNNLFRKCCESCYFPVFDFWHMNLIIQGACYKNRQQHGRTMHTVKNEALFYRPFLLTKIKDDIKNCHQNFSLYQSKMLKKAHRLQFSIDNALYDLLNYVFCDFDFKHRCLKQKTEMITYISSLQRYEWIYEHSSNSPLQFLSSLKKDILPPINITFHTSQFYMTESLNKEHVMGSLSEIQITERGNRRKGNQNLLQLMPEAEFHHSITVAGVYCCYHISCETSDRVWVSNRENNLILTNTSGDTLHRVEDSRVHLYGLHTVNNESELIYIDKNYNINKLSKDMKTTTTLIERTYSAWEPKCVYWSFSSGDLLVGMYMHKLWTGKVSRYNKNGQLKQTIQHSNTGKELYGKPNYITVNNNEDVVVSEHFYDFDNVSDYKDFMSGAVVVTDREGRHRFSYTEHPSGSVLKPCGICTDALSHILLCDGATNTVQMLDKDGQFLSHLLIRPSGIFDPCSLSYDVNTHRLWVGSRNNNTVVIYRYITRQDAMTDLNSGTSDVMEALREIQTTGTEIPHQGNQCLLKLMSPPTLLSSLTMTGVYCCYHISCVTSDRVWVSDGRNSLILTSTTGVLLHRVEDICRVLYGGFHTVNSESELFYIDKNYNINKLSKDMKTTTTFIERTYPTWRPWCVYWSPSTGDLLVGVNTRIYNRRTHKAKVTRYNQSGQLTQTIQKDNTGLELYTQPVYITENNNGDVVVSDFNAVVVTERGGRHRFSYTGHPSGSGLRSFGICTDALSHILVCDDTTKTVQMLDRDGQFLSHLPVRPARKFVARGLSYDVNAHRLWVGSYNNKLCVYRCIDRQDATTDKDIHFPDEDAFISSTSAVE